MANSKWRMAKVLIIRWCIATRNNVPTPYSPTPYSPTPYSPTPYSPTPYSPTPHSPTPYSPTPLLPQIPTQKFNPIIGHIQLVDAGMLVVAEALRDAQTLVDRADFGRFAARAFHRDQRIVFAHLDVERARADRPGDLRIEEDVRGVERRGGGPPRRARRAASCWRYWSCRVLGTSGCQAVWTTRYGKARVRDRTGEMLRFSIPSPK